MLNKRTINTVIFAFAVVLSFVLSNTSPAFSSQESKRRTPLRDPSDKSWSEPAPSVFNVTLETTKGRVVIEVHRDWAPIGVDRFYHLIRAKFYDDSRFFRVRAGAFVQFGIAGDPDVAGVWREQKIKDDPVKETNIRGTIAYAMTGPDTRTTQLYINLTDNSRLDKDGFAPLGRVIEGMDVLDRIYSAYGEEAGGGMRAGKQGKIFEGGNAHLDRDFPKLDRLIKAALGK
jgi:cyclophilin family peptidyl-prolyl cis-trans isomerase